MPCPRVTALTPKGHIVTHRRPAPKPLTDLSRTGGSFQNTWLQSWSGKVALSS